MSKPPLPIGAAYIIITCIIGITWTLLTYLIRLFLRTKVNGPFRWDDVACLGATIIGITQSVCTIAAVHYGLGYHQDDLESAHFDTFSILIWICGQLYTLGVGLAMLSITLLIARLSKTRHHLRLAHTITGCVAVWTCICLGLLIFNCNMPYPWQIDPLEKCLDRWAIWLGSTITQLLLELSNVATAWYIVWNVQMSRRPKNCILIAFVLRLLVFAPLLARLRYIYISVHGDDATYNRVDSTILSQVALHLSVILATVPCAKAFFVVFEGGVFRSPSHGLPASRQSYDEFRDDPRDMQEADGSRPT